MEYIHERAKWPNLTWDNAKLSSVLADVRHRQGRLLGRMEGLGFLFRSEAQLSTLTADVVQSSAIEGEKLDANEVRSSIARRLARISHTFRREAQREPCSGNEGADFSGGLCECTLPATKIKPDAANA
jgi:Fic family protein